MSLEGGGANCCRRTFGRTPFDASRLGGGGKVSWCIVETADRVLSVGSSAICTVNVSTHGSF